MKNFPATNVFKKMGVGLSNDGSELTVVITVPSDEYGVIWKLWVDLDVNSETDLENLPAKLSIVITIGSTTWPVDLHPYLAHDDGTRFFRHVDLGPWAFDFGDDGYYSGVRGDNIVIVVPSAGTGIKARIRYIYSGD